MKRFQGERISSLLLPSVQIAAEFRYVTCRSCVECSHQFSKSDRKKEYDKAYNEENAELLSIKRKAYYEANREKRQIVLLF